jgi:hypothetical protein
VGKVGINAIVDELSGPRGASVSHSTKHALFEVAENLRLVRDDHATLAKAQRTFFKVGAIAYTGLSDLDEIDYAKKLIALIQKRLDSVERATALLIRQLAPLVADLPKLYGKFEETQRKVAEASGRAANARANYKKLRAAIAEAM